MSASATPSDFATSARPADGVWLGDHISSLPSVHFATHDSGSSDACGRKGYSYAASTTFAPLVWRAASTSPSAYSDTAGACIDSSVARAANAALLCCAVA